MALNSTKKIIIQTGGLLLLALGIIVGIFVPALGYIKKTANENYTLKTLTAQKLKEASLPRITQQKLEEIKAASLNFYPFLFKTGDELKLITFLETLSAKHNLTQTINNSNLDRVDNTRIASISLNLNGNYTDTLRYLADLESSNYFIYVTQVSFTPNSLRNGEATPNTNLSLTIALYVNK